MDKTFPYEATAIKLKDFLDAVNGDSQDENVVQFRNNLVGANTEYQQRANRLGALVKFMDN
ncbi:TPA: hypothetical protein M9Y74_005308 [Klebsiella variicola subsp. variicola]|nr:hypothetical protein [Klebsiella variicola subsp. variicola]